MRFCGWSILDPARGRRQLVFSCEKKRRAGLPADLKRPIEYWAKGLEQVVLDPIYRGAEPPLPKYTVAVTVPFD